ncbi:LEAF RUST 10 DISEASE-RESISTANCE LOCUS RECEPTOR-LIKE PROTEIN KINASE-like 2.2 [Senna tora]|uniref:LEAF RUST 10 DISEASE-RESISTANCE LOCUS RECEPTOR-LIKE PROTEIN KINASE-like 2.2 n=1 Tax=Senna tora TaxID=362788 RepID=A0A834W2N8_9FABA|nr:LEAF RUST 10 DISEASE-RESISTANCE LOCUS RECEPTOR-LIKE PROTEIN KINASE-like 2.2 [Senna tora]
MDFYYSPPSHTSSFDDSFDKFSGDVGSTMKWAVVGSIVSFVVMIIAIVAIAYAIIECLKKAGTMIPSYTQIPTTDNLKASNNENIAISIPPDSSQVEFATMERFLNNITREKPIRYSPTELEEITHNYSTILGAGAFGVVYKGKLSPEEHVAVKILNNFDMGMEEQFKAEVSTIGRTYHINLVRLFGFCFHTDKIALIYEYVQNGSLNNFLFGSNNREIELLKLHEIAIGTAKGIAYLHEECQHRIIHYDIKPENILLDMNLEPKVADFGLARLCNREISHVNMTHFRGTRGYAAPELWKLCPVTHKCDVYSFGILLFEIVGRRRHFDGSYSESKQWFPKWAWDMFENGEMGVMVSLCGIEEKDREMAERMLMVALWCVQFEPGDRPLMSNVVKMLEGDMGISPPPFPFQNLVSGKLNLSPMGNDHGLDDSSSWGTESSDQSKHPKLRRGVTRRPSPSGHSYVSVLPVTELGQTEIRYLGAQVIVQEDVARFYVVVDDPLLAFLVQVRDPSRGPHRDLVELLESQGGPLAIGFAAVVQIIVQRSVSHVLVNKCPRVILEAESGEADEIEVMDSPDCAHFRDELLLHSPIVGTLIQNLHRDDGLVGVATENPFVHRSETSRP